MKKYVLRHGRAKKVREGENWENFGNSFKIMQIPT
jgi:hypothetical protein